MRQSTSSPKRDFCFRLISKPAFVSYKSTALDITSLLLKSLPTYLQPRASEGFFPGGASREFSQIFCRGGQKWWNLFFTPRNWKKQPFFANNFKIQGGGKAPSPPPDARVYSFGRSLWHVLILKTVVITLYPTANCYDCLWQVSKKAHLGPHGGAGKGAFPLGFGNLTFSCYIFSKKGLFP